MIRKPTLLPLVAAMLLATACGSRDAAADKQGDLIESIADDVAAEVRHELASENITVDGVAGLPKAELTPEGDLVIDGNTITLKADQRALAIAYRNALADVAEAGARIGLKGADVAKDAAAAAIAGVMSGETADIEAQIKDSTDRLKAEALQLCEALPALMAKEQALAAAVPEFAPYAEMTQDDIDDCMNDPDLRRAAAEVHDAGGEHDADGPHGAHDTDDAEASSLEEDATKPYEAT